MGTRARVKTPYVVTTTSPATVATAAPKSHLAIHHVARTTPSAASSEGMAALACVTDPRGQEAKAMSQA